MNKRRGQGAFEYLLLLGGTVLISVVAIVVVQSSAQSANDNLAGSANDYSTFVHGGVRNVLGIAVTSPIPSPSSSPTLSPTPSPSPYPSPSPSPIPSPSTCPAPTTFPCTNSVTFTYKGSSVTYGTVAHNGQCWFDRNLGASVVATSYTDSNGYGDLFQWGRLDDGHQTRTSGTTVTLSSTDTPGHGNFIISTVNPRDWRSPQNANLWQGVSGVNNPCPCGWRLPTYEEWNTEKTSWTSQSYTGAYASPLKLPAGGIRDVFSSSLVFVNTYGYYWSSNATAQNAFELRFNSNTAIMNSGDARGNGCSVRCIKD